MPEAITHLVYCGRSMWPCFQDGDILEIQPTTIDALQVGDCISFRQDDGEPIHTHRVCSLHDGIHTRGDAHLEKDDQSVEPEWLVGKVTGCLRLGTARPVCGGRKGALLAHVYHYAGRIDPTRDSRGGRLARIIRSLMQYYTQSLYACGETKSFPSDDGKLVEYWLVNDKIRARRAETQWQIPWPWSLFFDENKLP